MSFIGGTQRDTITIKRLSVTQDTSGEGGQIRTYTTAARGSRPTTGFKCRLQQLNSEEKLAYGIKGSSNGWKILASTDPQAGVEDAIEFTDVNGNAHGGDSNPVRIIEPSRDIDNQGRVYRAIAEEETNRA